MYKDYFQKLMHNLFPDCGIVYIDEKEYVSAILLGKKGQYRFTILGCDYKLHALALVEIFGSDKSGWYKIEGFDAEYLGGVKIE